MLSDASDPAVPGGCAPPGCLKIPKLLSVYQPHPRFTERGVFAYIDFLCGLMDQEMVFPPAQSTQRQIYACYL